MMETKSPAARVAFRAGRWETGTRAVPCEVAVALVYNGTTQAVMMATPADLTDFAKGFSLTEQIVTEISEITEIEEVCQPSGIELRIVLTDTAGDRFSARRRAQVGPVGCGLCGIDSLTEALRPLPAVKAGLVLSAADVADAMQGLVRHQALNDATRAVHAAGFYIPGKGVTLAREDVGRHNALDKLAGALARTGTVASTGAVVLTSRVSVDMVQKAAILGAPVLIAASAPTALAIAEADAAGITLVAVARGADFEVFTHPERFAQGRAADVA
jgi:FdhD protein